MVVWVPETLGKGSRVKAAKSLSAPSPVFTSLAKPSTERESAKQKQRLGRQLWERLKGIVKNLSLLIPELLKLQKSWWKLTICAQAEHHMLLPSPGERTANNQLLPSPQWTELSLHSLRLSDEMQFNQSGPRTLNLWKSSANISLEKASVVLVLVTVMQSLKGKKAYTRYDFAMAPTKGLWDFRCI